MNVKVKISALLLCAALLFDTVGAAAATGFEDKRLEVVAGMTAGVSADIPNGMKKTAENGGVSLYLDSETTRFAVKNNSSGAVWLSSPADTQFDRVDTGEQLTALNSNVIVNFYNSSGTLTSYDSYNYSVAYGNFTVKEIKNGFSVTYRIGKQKKVTAADIPTVMYADRFESFLKKMDSKTASDIKARYRLYSYSAARSDTMKKKILSEYPSAEKGDIYALRNKEDAMAQFIFDSFTAAGYTEEDLKNDNKAHGITSKPEKQTVFGLTLEITLDGGRLKAAVDCKNLSFPEKTPLTSVEILPFFGAANVASAGYIFIPDGSGSLIRLNDPSNSSEQLTVPLYGNDETLRSSDTSAVTAGCALPVFGLKNGDEAFYAVIESGDAVAGINAVGPGAAGAYNRVWAGFTVNPRETFSAAENAAQTVMYPKKKYDGRLEMSFGFLSGEKADYIGMAESFREYLQENGRLSKKTVSESSMPFLLETVGLTTREASFLGLVKYDKKTVLTTYSQGLEIVEKLKAAGLDNIIYRMNGWNASGLDSSATDKIRAEKKLGGKKELLRVLAELKKADVRVYAAINLQEIIKPSVLFNKKKNAVRQIGEVYLMRRDRNYATGEEESDSRVKYLLSPYKYAETAASAASIIADYGFSGICTGAMGKRLYSDQSASHFSSRSDSERYVTESLEKISASGSLMMQFGNLYALQHSDIIYDAPIGSSGYRNCGEEVPFYQIVFHGYKLYSGIAWNHSDDPENYILKCIEYGAVPYYQWAYAPSSTVKNTYSSEYYLLGYADTFDSAVENCLRMNERLSSAVSSSIVNHTAVLSGVYRTDYENGLSVTVNYNDTAVNIGSVQIAPHDWSVTEKGG